MSTPLPVLVLVAHGTRSLEGARTLSQITESIAAARADITVELAYLDVLHPRLDRVLARLTAVGRSVVLVPMLLSRGFHVDTDLPRITRAYPQVAVAPHLGPDPAVVEAIADRLTSVEHQRAASTVLAVVGSSRPSAQQEVNIAARLLEERLGRAIVPIALTDAAAELVSALPRPITVAPYLIAHGTLLTRLRDAQLSGTTVSEPIGAHPALIRLILERYDALRAVG